MSLISVILLYFPPRRGGGVVTTTTVSFTVFILNSLLSQPKLTKKYLLLSVQKLSVAVEKKIISHSNFEFAKKRLSVWKQALQNGISFKLCLFPPLQKFYLHEKKPLNMYVLYSLFRLERNYWSTFTINFESSHIHTINMFISILIPRFN